MALVSLFEVFLAIICFVILSCLRNNEHDGPPKYFPVVGMLPEILQNIHRFHDWITEILERCQLTFLFKCPWSADMNFWVTCDPANIHYIMSSNFGNFPKGSEFKEMFDFLGDGIFNSDLDLWKTQRKAAQGFMRHQMFNQFLVRTSQAKVENGLIPVLDHVAKRGSVINLEDVFQRFTFDSICILVTGYDPKCLSVQFPEIPFAKALDDAEEAVFYRHVRPKSFVKQQKWLNVGQEKKYRKAWEILDEMIPKYISQKREELKKQNKGFVSEINSGEEGVDLLTSYIIEEKSTGLKSDDDKFLRDTILNMMLAGRDTTSSALTWFFWLISRHPKVEKKIIQELESVIPEEETKKRRLFKPDEIKDLVYLHGALCESLRLFLQRAFGTRHSSKRAPCFSKYENLV